MEFKGHPGLVSSIHAAASNSGALQRGQARVKCQMFDITDATARKTYEEIYTKAFFQREGFKLVREPQTFFSTKTDILSVYLEWVEPYSP